MDYKGAGLEDMGLIHMAYDRDQWQAHANIVLNLCVQCISVMPLHYWYCGKHEGRVKLCCPYPPQFWCLVWYQSPAVIYWHNCCKALL